MRALFFGTPAIAVPALEALYAIADVVGVVCQPDRPAGRGMEVAHPPVKARALELGLHVEQPLKVRVPEFAEWVRSREADVALVIAYGRILPLAVLSAPRKGCVNLHASILPRYRGAAPITWCLARGETETGISLMQMDEGMDTGPVFTIHALPIGAETTAGELTVELGKLAADVVHEDLARVVAGELTATPQDHATATTAPILKKEDGRIDWRKPAKELHDHVRAMSPWPGAFTMINGKTFKVLEARLAPGSGSGSGSGSVLAAGKEGIDVACGDGVLRVLRGQLEGRKALGAGDLASGRAVTVGMRFD